MQETSVQTNSNRRGSWHRGAVSLSGPQSRQSSSVAHWELAPLVGQHGRYGGKGVKQSPSFAGQRHMRRVLPGLQLLYCLLAWPHRATILLTNQNACRADSKEPPSEHGTTPCYHPACTHSGDATDTVNRTLPLGSQKTAVPTLPAAMKWGSRQI